MAHRKNLRRELLERVRPNDTKEMGRASKTYPKNAKEDRQMVMLHRNRA